MESWKYHCNDFDTAFTKQLMKSILILDEDGNHINQWYSPVVELLLTLGTTRMYIYDWIYHRTHTHTATLSEPKFF